MAQRYRQAVGVLPGELRQAALLLPEGEQREAEELRLRVGWPMTVVCRTEEIAVGKRAVEQRDLERLLELASHASLHTVLDRLCEGYLTMEGGHRIGVCGTVVLRGENVQGFRGISSANIRIARQIPGVASGVLSRLCVGGQLESTLVLAPPGLGKTTLLRDLIRQVSEGEGCAPLRISVADERGELAACCGGVPQLDVGRRTDVLDGGQKAKSLMALLRAMNPQALAVDEITAPGDVAALRMASGCGVILLATAHGASFSDLKRRELYRNIWEDGIFRYLVRITRDSESGRCYTVEDLR